MLEPYQQERVNLIKEILPLFGDNFVLKGGTALSLYYGLNRYSEDIDLDAKTNNMNIVNKLKAHKNFKTWNITIKKDTSTTFRVMIDYGASFAMGAYPLKIEVSNRNKHNLQNKILNVQKIERVNVYEINELVNMKVAAFEGRNKIRDFYDVGFLLEKYPKHFTKENLLNTQGKIGFFGEEELDLLLKDEAKKHKLVWADKMMNLDNYAKILLKKIDKLLLNFKNNNPKEWAFNARKDLKAIQTALFDKYKINVDEKDPIWAVLTANTPFFTEYVGKMEQALIRQKSELETFKDRFIAELDKEHKDTAKNIEEKLEKLKDYEKQRRLEIDKMFENFMKGFNNLKSDEYKLNKRTLIFFFGGQIISLLLGLAVGLMLF